jgi:uncharacterized membrane protein YidH (DUF202 family)
MKIKKDPFNLVQMEKEEARRKKEMARMEREELKRIIEADKKEFNHEKYRIVLERLQLNWLQWNITCMLLGFGIYKFYYSRLISGADPIGTTINGWHIGIVLISVGLISLLAATIQHKTNVTKLKLQFEAMQYSISLRVSYFILIFSVFMLLVVIFKG